MAMFGMKKDKPKKHKIVQKKYVPHSEVYPKPKKFYKLQGYTNGCSGCGCSLIFALFLITSSSYLTAFITSVCNLVM